MTSLSDMLRRLSTEAFTRRRPCIRRSDTSTRYPCLLVIGRLCRSPAHTSCRTLSVKTLLVEIVNALFGICRDLYGPATHEGVLQVHTRHSNFRQVKEEDKGPRRCCHPDRGEVAKGPKDSTPTLLTLRLWSWRWQVNSLRTILATAAAWDIISWILCQMQAHLLPLQET